MTIDQVGFDKAMQEQRRRARQAWKGSGEETIEAIYKRIVQDGVRVTFVGYDRLSHSSTVLRLICDSTLCDCANEGEDVEIIVSETPFYGESGGQVGDAGTMSGKGFTVSVTDTQKVLPELIVHRGRVVSGTIRTGVTACLEVIESRRRATACNHTATHILHAVLRQRLGNHVKQAGSLVASDRLRFDFTHFAPLTAEELDVIEQEVNRHIQANTLLSIQELDHEEAIKKGAIALFGEKYGERVRVVSIPSLSMELCGGTHCRATGEIGFFKILSEGAVAAGVRRIEAITGAAACCFVQEQSRTLARLADMFKTEPAGLVEKTARLLAEHKNLEKEVERLKAKIRTHEAAVLLDKARDIAGVKVLCTRVQEHDPKSLRSWGDKIRDRMGSGIIVFGSTGPASASLLVMVTKDLTGRFSARKIIDRIAPLVNGKGGGRDDLAQAGGSGVDGLDAALKHAQQVIAEMATQA